MASLDGQSVKTLSKGDFYRLQTCDLRAWAPKIWSEVSVNRPNSKNAPACSWMSSKALIKVNILKTLAKHAQIFVINSRRPPIWCQSHRRSCILRFNKSTSMSSEKITCKCLLISSKSIRETFVLHVWSLSAPCDLLILDLQLNTHFPNSLPTNVTSAWNSMFMIQTALT